MSRTLLEAPAIEIDEFYQRMFAGILDAIPVAVYNAFNFTVVDAVKARGTVVITFSSPVVEQFTIYADTVFRSNNDVNYLSEANVVVPALSTSISVIVICDQAGTIGNTGTGTITSAIGYVLPNTASISNSAITSGIDTESEAARISRFNDYIASLVRGTPHSVLFIAKSAVIRDINNVVTDYVSRAGLVEEPGHVYVYIYGASGTASTALIEKAQQLVDGYKTELGVNVPGYRPAGMRVEVVTMTVQSVNVTATVKLFAGNVGNSTLTNLIDDELSALMLSISAGSILYSSAVSEAILSVLGVESVMLTGSSNILCAENKVLQLGTLAITYA